MPPTGQAAPAGIQRSIEGSLLHLAMMMLLFALFSVAIGQVSLLGEGEAPTHHDAAGGTFAGAGDSSSHGGVPNHDWLAIAESNEQITEAPEPEGEAAPADDGADAGGDDDGADEPASEGGDNQANVGDTDDDPDADATEGGSPAAVLTGLAALAAGVAF